MTTLNYKCLITVCVATLFCVYLPNHSIWATSFHTCKSGVSPPTSLEVSGCDAPPCPFKKGANVTWEFNFIADEDHDEIVTVFQASIGSMVQGLPGIDGKPSCNYLFSHPEREPVGCTLQKGKAYIFSLFIPLNKPAPKMTINSHCALKDKKTKKEFVCTELPVTIK